LFVSKGNVGLFFTVIKVTGDIPGGHEQAVTNLARAALSHL
jgi:hypothetical protein